MELDFSIPPDRTRTKSPSKSPEKSPGKHLPSLPINRITSIAMPTLKRRTTESFLTWVEYDLSLYQSKIDDAPRDRMRNLGRLRNHSPIPSECSLLRITDSRKNTHSQKDFLLLCGGAVGTRFSGDELKLIVTSIARLDRLWNDIDRIYKTFPNRYSAPSLDAAAQLEYENNLKQFNDWIYEYFEVLKPLQALAKEKQQSIGTDPTLTIGSDTDPENSIGSRYPKWLETLKTKFDNALIDSGASEKAKIFRVGRFAVYLSLCAEGSITCSNEEKDALHELTEASRDVVEIFHVSNVSTTVLHDRSRYYARRFYNFLRAMPELNSAIRDEVAVETMTYT